MLCKSWRWTIWMISRPIIWLDIGKTTVITTTLVVLSFDESHKSHCLESWHNWLKRISITALPFPNILELNDVFKGSRLSLRWYYSIILNNLNFTNSFIWELPFWECTFWEIGSWYSETNSMKVWISTSKILQTPTQHQTNIKLILAPLYWHS